MHDPDPGAARAVAESNEGVGALRDVPVHVHPTARAVAGESEIVLMATWSRTPLLGRADVRSGTHITSLGADEPGKAELNDDLLAASLVVTDDEQLYGDVWRRSTRRSPGFSGTSGRAAQTQGRSPCTAPSAYPCRTSSPPGTPTNELAPARSAPTSTWSAESSHSTIVSGTTGLVRTVSPVGVTAAVGSAGSSAARWSTSTTRRAGADRKAGRHRRPVHVLSEGFGTVRR